MERWSGKIMKKQNCWEEKSVTKIIKQDVGGLECWEWGRVVIYTGWSGKTLKAVRIEPPSTWDDCSKQRPPSARTARWASLARSSL